MSRKYTLFLLVFALMTTFLAPARLVLACQMQSQTTPCPMMAARRNAEEASCCTKKSTPSATVISAPCCCKLQSAPAPPSLPAALAVTESPVFVLSSVAVPLHAPLATTVLRAAVALELSAPRGPPLPFAALRAPPLFS